LRLFLISLWLALLCLPALSSTLTPIRLRVGGRDVLLKTPAVTDGKETYVPYEALLAVGARGEVNDKEDSITITVRSTQQTRELAIARIRGKGMLALSDLARLLNAEVRYGSQTQTASGEKPSASSAQPLVSGAAAGAKRPAAPDPRETGKAENVVHLLARVTAVRFIEGTLQVTTSFPVPYRVRTLTQNGPIRGYIDCLGASLPDNMRIFSPGEVDKRVVALRAGQNTPEIARIVIELTEHWGLKEADSPGNSSHRILAGLELLSPETLRARSARNANPTRTDSSQPAARVQRPGQIDTPLSTTLRGNEAAAQSPAPAERATQPDAESNPTLRVVLPPTPDNAATGATTPLPAPAAPKQTGKPAPPPIEIQDLKFDLTDSRRVRLEMKTSGKAVTRVRYQPNATQLIVDIPNAKLSLEEADRATQSYTHPLVTGMHAEQVQESPPLTRITLDMTRVLGFSTNQEAHRATLDLRIPRNATGPLAGKLVVVDPGHGGSSSGAPGGGGIYEKNIVLAISLKLRAALEACGVNVIMTREKDETVPLYDRPRKANDVNADFFISVHNDSVSRRNTASGTSTYYHKGDASSRALAVCVQQAIVGISGLPNRGALSDGILYENGLAVLRASKMPAILVEVAYINHDRDRAKLISPEFQQRVALAIVRGLRKYVEGNPTPANDVPVEEDLLIERKPPATPDDDGEQ
jgi:N-acetylmuramoyl-L-alanine amidase